MAVASCAAEYVEGAGDFVWYQSGSRLRALASKEMPLGHGVVGGAIAHKVERTLQAVARRLPGRYLICSSHCPLQRGSIPILQM